MISTILVALLMTLTLGDRDLLSHSSSEEGSEIEEYHYFVMAPYIAEPGQLFAFRDAFMNDILPYVESSEGFVDAKLGFDIGSNTFVAYYEFENKYKFMNMALTLPFTPEILQLVKEKKDSSSIDLFDIGQEP